MKYNFYGKKKIKITNMDILNLNNGYTVVKEAYTIEPIN